MKKLVMLVLAIAMLALPVMAMAYPTVTTLAELKANANSTEYIVIPNGTNIDLGGATIELKSFLDVYGNCTISNGTIKGNQYALVINSVDGSSNVVLKNVKLEATYPIYLYDANNKVTLENCETTGWGAIAFARGNDGGNGTVTVTKSTINTQNPYGGMTNSYSAFAFESSNNNLTLTDSTVNLTANGESEQRAFNFGYNNTEHGGVAVEASNNTVSINNTKFNHTKQTQSIVSADASKNNVVNLNTEGIHFVKGTLADTDNVTVNVASNLVSESDGKGGWIVKTIAAVIEDYDLPETGDKENLMMWVALMGMAIVGLALNRKASRE